MNPENCQKIAFFTYVSRNKLTLTQRNISQKFLEQIVTPLLHRLLSYFLYLAFFCQHCVQTKLYSRMSLRPLFKKARASDDKDSLFPP